MAATGPEHQQAAEIGQEPGQAAGQPESAAIRRCYRHGVPPAHRPVPGCAARYPDQGELVSARPSGARTASEILAAARARLRRLPAPEAFAETRRGAWLVDIRSAAQRKSGGEIPGALVVERNVLEWRFDPMSATRLPCVTCYDHRVIVLCAEGYQSSLAAASLQDLGLFHTTDVEGGFKSWAAFGLPAARLAPWPRWRLGRRRAPAGVVPGFVYR